MALIILGFICVIGIYAGYEIGAKGQKQRYETLIYLIESERDLDTVQNLKALEGLREREVKTIIQFMEVRVKASLQYNGIKKETVNRARKYQQEFCDNECLGIK